MTHHRRELAWLALLFLLAAPLATTAAASAAAPFQKKDGGMEDFEEVDPYTKGDPERMEALGYVRYAPFPWRKQDRTVDIEKVMGGIDMLWVETEHFQIGSSLSTYSIPNDRPERARIAEELARLKKKLGRFKPPKRELDPWLRLHLYAQRAEDLYAKFVADFDLEPAHYSATGSHLGQPRKFQILLCQRKSEFNRFLGVYLDARNDYSYRWGWPEGGLFYGSNIEGIRASYTQPEEEPFDTMLHCRLASGLAANFLDGYRMTYSLAPTWLMHALGHRYARGIDPRWLSSAGKTVGRDPEEEDWNWQPRVRQLVQNDFFATTDKMLAWTKYEDMNERDHMVAWSKLEYLIDVAKGDKPALIAGLCAASAPPPLPAEGESDAAEEASDEPPDPVARQKEALASAVSLTPDELDAAWKKWVKKTYRRK